MPQSIEKVVSLLFRKKTISLVLLFFVLLVALVSPLQVFAKAWWEYIPGVSAAKEAVGSAWEAIQSLPLRLLGTAFWLLASLAAGVADLSVAFLKWILSPNFINVSYTDPARNEIIKIGLNITQSFVNMILVLVLVYIALATILRLAGYQTKKLLVTFIIVALLVNFAPVICGLIVDAANITMNFFLGGLNPGANLFGKLGTLYGTFAGELWGNLEDRGNLGQAVIKIFVLGVVYHISSLVYLLFALVFLARYIVIWLLVILSPIAFACYVLPVTKRFWSLWWNQFIQWSIIGITCGFFLYLAEKFTEIGVAHLSTPGKTIGSSVLQHCIPIAFLALGLVFGLQTGAMGAQTIIGLGKRGEKWVGKKTARGVGRFVQEKARTKEAARWLSKQVEKVPAARWFLPEKLKKYGEFRPAVEAAQAEAKTYSSEVNMDDVMKGAAIGTRATGKTLETIMRGDSEDIFHAGRRAFGKNLTDEQLLKDPRFNKKMRRTLQIAGNSGLLNDFIRRDPRLASLLTGQKWAGAYATMSESEAIKKATGEVRRGHINNWEREVLENETVVEALLERGREPFEAIDTQVKRGQETTLATIDKLFTKSGKSWEEFIGDKGYGKALQSSRFTDRGWRAGQKVTLGAPPTPSTPGAAAGVTPPAPAPPPAPPPPPPPPPPPRGRRAGGAGPPKGRKV